MLLPPRQPLLRIRGDCALLDQKARGGIVNNKHV
jgi:hypothetical protein